LWPLGAALLWACAFACSAYDNADTPGHALGSGGTSASAQGGGGATNAAGGTLAQGGSTAALGGGGTFAQAGSAGTVGQAGALSSSGGTGGSPIASAGSGGSNGGGGATGGANGGVGGGAGNGMCSAHPLTAMSQWTVTASASSATDVPAHAIDGDLTTRWSSGKDQAGDEWLQVDFGADVTVKKVTLKLGSNTSDYPRSYKTRLTDSANDLAATPQVMGSGASATDTVMTFGAPTTGRYLLITQGGTATGLWWSVAEISVECTD